MSGNRIDVDDKNFIFLESGTYPQEYIGLEPVLYFPNYYNDTIKPWKDGKDYSNSRFDTLAMTSSFQYPVKEYWERVPDSIRSFGRAYVTIPDNIYVSSYGRIYDASNKTAVPIYLRKDGYLGVFHMIALHRIILYTFCPVPNFLDLTVDHKNFVTIDNCLWNLRWMSSYDNIRRSIDMGNRTNPYFQKGSNNIRSTMTEYQAELCCRALRSHLYNYQQIAYALGITVRQVKHIKDCDVHLDICEKYDMQNNDFDYRRLKNNKDNILPLLDVS